MAHRGKDLGAQPRIAGRSGQVEGQSEVALGEAVFGHVVRLPPGELSQFGNGGEQPAAGRQVVPALDHEGCDLVVQEAGDVVASVPAAVLVVETPIGGGHLADGVDVRLTDCPVPLLLDGLRCGGGEPA